MAITKNSQIDLNGNEMILDADGDTTITADTDDQIDFKTAGTDRVQINSTGDFLVRQTSADVYDTNTGGTVRQFWGNQFSAQNNTASRVIIGSGSNAGLVGGATLNSGGTRPIVNSYISFGSTNQTAGSEAGMVQFYTSTGGATGVVRARIDSDGLKFGSDTAASNALDDYEEGTWSPTLIAETGTSGQSYDRQYGYYTKIGDFVFLTFDVRVTNIGTSPSGALLTLGNHGFTFTSTNTGGMGLCGWFNLPNLGTNQVNFYANGSYIYCMEGSSTYIDIANHLTTNSRLIGGFCGQINR